MAIVGVIQYSTTPATNIDVNSISIAEFCPISNLNNSQRQIMADISTRFQDTNTIAAAATTDLGTIAQNYLTVTGTGGPITSFGTPTNKLDYYLRFTGAAMITTSANLIWAGLSSAVTVTLSAGDLLMVRYEGTSVWRILWCRTSTGLFYGGDAATSGYVLTAGGVGVAPTWAQQGVVKGAIFGLTLAPGTDAIHDIDIAVGTATDNANALTMTLGSTMTKQLDATWAAGTAAGGLFSGATAVGANGVYHVQLIRKTSDGTIDAGFDSSVTAANIPAGYAAFRRLGSIRLDASSQIIAFHQYGDDFIFDLPIIDIDSTNPGTSAVTRALSVPTGVKFRAIIEAGHYSGTTSNMASYFSSLDQTDSVVTTPGTAALANMLNGAQTAASTAFWRLGRLNIWTNTSASIRSRLSASGAADHIGIITVGWMDTRGK